MKADFSSKTIHKRKQQNYITENDERNKKYCQLRIPNSETTSFKNVGKMKAFQTKSWEFLTSILTLQKLLKKNIS